MSLRQNALLVVALTALLAIVGSWSDSEGLSRAWCLPAALLLLALAYDRQLARRAAATLRIEAPPRWLLARPTAVTLEVSLQGTRTLVLELAPDAPVGVECNRAVRLLTVTPGVPARLALRTVPRRLGAQQWPALRARISGPLGLAWWPLRLLDPLSVRVAPDLLGRAVASRGASASGERASGRRGAGGEVLQLRAYQPGDPLRAIDWKATARSSQLIARDFSEDQHLEIVVGIDVGRSSSVWCGELDRLGHYVNLAARLAERAVALDDRVGLVLFGDRPLAALAPGRGLAAVTRLRAVLGAVQAQATDSNPIHAAARIRSLVRRRCLVILLTDIDDAASGSQLAGAVRLLRPLHLPLIVGLRSAAAESFAAAGAADWLDPYRALAAEENQLRQGRSIAALHALGATAMLTRPEHFEAAVFAAYARFRQQRRI